MKTLDWSVETLGREYNSIGHCIHLNITRAANVTRLFHLVAVNKLTSNFITLKKFL